jgi:hypothetical protein
MVPIVLTEMRGRNIESAHGHRAAPATLRLHQTYRSCVKHRTGARQAVPKTADCDSTASTAAKFLSDRLGDGHDYSPASYDARAVVRLTAPFSPDTPRGRARSNTG